MGTITLSAEDINERMQRLDKGISRTLVRFLQEIEKNAVPPVFVVGLLVRVAMRTAKRLPEMKDDLDVLWLVRDLAEAHTCGIQQFADCLDKLAGGIKKGLKNRADEVLSKKKTNNAKDRE